MRFTPMPLSSVREPFDDPDWIFEPKWDGFRALAYIDGHHCRLVSRRDNIYKSWPYRRNFITAMHVDLLEWAEDLGVLRSYERLADDRTESY
jgi:hypothetical protein